MYNIIFFFLYRLLLIIECKVKIVLCVLQFGLKLNCVFVIILLYFDYFNNFLFKIEVNNLYILLIRFIFLQLLGFVELFFLNIGIIIEEDYVLGKILVFNI